YEQALALQPDNFSVRNSLALAHSDARQGNIHRHLSRAEELLKENLSEVKYPSNAWALTQNNLGIVLSKQAAQSTGQASTNLISEATTAYHAALEVDTLEDSPNRWASTQINLGNLLLLESLLLGGEAGASKLIE